MAGYIGFAGKPPKEIPDCPNCSDNLRFDGMSDTLSYISGKSTILGCNTCDREYYCKDGKVEKEKK